MVLDHEDKIYKTVSFHTSSDAPYYSPNKLLNKLYEERVSRKIVNAATSQTSPGAKVASPQAHSVVNFSETLWRVKVICKKIRLVFSAPVLVCSEN